MSTHYIEEAERLADTVTIMSHGKAVAVGLARATSSPSTPGGEAIEVYGPPARLAEVEADEARRGLAARGAPAPRSRCCASSDDGGRAPAGERRAANLEDVFVLLTGEEID